MTSSASSTGPSVPAAMRAAPRRILAGADSRGLRPVGAVDPRPERPQRAGDRERDPGDRGRRPVGLHQHEGDDAADGREGRRDEHSHGDDRWHAGRHPQRAVRQRADRADEHHEDAAPDRRDSRGTRSRVREERRRERRHREPGREQQRRGHATTLGCRVAGIRRRLASRRGSGAGRAAGGGEPPARRAAGRRRPPASRPRRRPHRRRSVPAATAGSTRPRTTRTPWRAAPPGAPARRAR